MSLSIIGAMLSDREISERCDPNSKFPMIKPFEPKQISWVEKNFGMEKVISYGASSYGYDARLVDEYDVFSAAKAPEAIIDPKRFDKTCLERKKGPYVTIPPNSFALSQTLEEFWIPRDILVLCIGKSTYARCGIIVNVTPLEPEWYGHITIEISNTAPLPARVYGNEGICQLVFLKKNGELCETSYADKKGKYQGQQEVTPPKV